MLNKIGFGLIFILGLIMVACSPTASARDTSPTAGITEDASPAAKLRAAGAMVEVADQISQPFFSAPAQLIRVNGQEVQVFTYEDATTAEAEAAQVSPSGSSIGTDMVSWMATPHFYRFENVIVLYVGDDEATLTVLADVFGPQFAGGQGGNDGDEITVAALAGLEAIGWDIKGFEAAVRAVDGDYANVTITSTNPPGGFTAFMIRQDGEWTVAAHGSAYNPEELKAMGFPDSVLK